MQAAAEDDFLGEGAVATLLSGIEEGARVQVDEVAARGEEVGAER